MLAETFYPILIILFLSLFIIKSDYFKKSGISSSLLIFGFLLKCISAFYFGYLFHNNILSGNDTFNYLRNSEIIFASIQESWLTFFKLTFGKNDFSNPASNLLPYIDKMDFWYDTSNYLMVRINAIIRLFSFGIYNIHAVIFAFISFIGIYNLYLFFENKVFNKRILQFILFGIPSIVFWTSGVHKEAIVIFALGIILNNTDKIFNNQYQRKHILLTIFGLFVLGSIRIYVLAFLIPLYIVIILSRHISFSNGKYKLYTAIILLGIISLALIDTLIPNFSLLQEFLIRREHFLNTTGNTTFEVITSFNTMENIITILFDAIINPFIHPFPNESNLFLVFIASLETYLMLFIILAILFSLSYKNLYKSPYALFCILFSLCILFLIGLIVNNSGAIVRYRSIAIPFLLIGLCILYKPIEIQPVSLKK